ncbi:MAG: hypothetical protein AAF639_43085 [Chloroflexota bacterium]
MQRSLSGILWIPVSIIGGLLMGAAGVSLCSAFCSMIPNNIPLGVLLGSVEWLLYALVTVSVLALVIKTTREM